MDRSTAWILGGTAAVMGAIGWLWRVIERRHQQTAARLERLQAAAEEHSADHKIIRVELGMLDERMVDRSNGLWSKLDTVRDHVLGLKAALVARWKGEKPLEPPEGKEPPP